MHMHTYMLDLLDLVGVVLLTTVY